MRAPTHSTDTARRRERPQFRVTHRTRIGDCGKSEYRAATLFLLSESFTTRINRERVADSDRVWWPFTVTDRVTVRGSEGSEKHTERQRHRERDRERDRERK